MALGRSYLLSMYGNLCEHDMLHGKEKRALLRRFFDSMSWRKERCGMDLGDIAFMYEGKSSR